jgi:hypothetical protein
LFIERFLQDFLRPYYPMPELYRVVNGQQGLQLDFMPRLDGIRSFERLRARATKLAFGNHELLVADLADMIKSKRAAARNRDLAVLDGRRKASSDRLEPFHIRRAPVTTLDVDFMFRKTPPRRFPP